MTEVYAAAYEIYWNLGHRGVLPLPPRKKKSPPKGFTGHDGVYPSYADVFAWAGEKPDGNLCLRVHDDTVGIDTDAYDGKPGAQTIADCENKWGKLPFSPRSSARYSNGDTVSGIRFYRIPAGVKLIEGLPGVEIVQKHHRYAVCWPSIHPDTGRQYRWFGIDGGELSAPPGIADTPDLPPRGSRGCASRTPTATAGLAPRGLTA